MKVNFNNFLFVIVLSLLIVGCATTKVERVDVEKKVDLSGKWNDHDAFLVSQEVIKDCLDKPWVAEFSNFRQREPVVIVGEIINNSNDHIEGAVITKHLERELLNSGKVNFVASHSERLQVRDERNDQQLGYTDPASQVQMGKERGADFILIGSINSIKDEVKGKIKNEEGKIREDLGKLTSDKSEQIKGKVQQVEGKVQ